LIGLFSHRFETEAHVIGNPRAVRLLQLKDGSEYSVDYKLYLSPAGWRVYDVIVEGISLVNNYRSQFDRVLNKKSFDALLQDLRDKKETFNY
jgi:phospholipid transport system substrate-binding protein